MCAGVCMCIGVFAYCACVHCVYTVCVYTVRVCVLCVCVQVCAHVPERSLHIYSGPIPTIPQSRLLFGYLHSNTGILPPLQRVQLPNMTASHQMHGTFYIRWSNLSLVNIFK